MHMHLFVVAFLLNAISMALIDEKNYKTDGDGQRSMSPFAIDKRETALTVMRHVMPCIKIKHLISISTLSSMAMLSALKAIVQSPKAWRVQHA
ncbi:hypothetical protein [Methylobacter luteus]|uniref:hypothetical protein n=1 Tax=Methylobacter luteus TaxID=415 RepID=UPI00040A83F4|nr:hypothetical protein [Methylobacter luteus]